MGRHLRGPSFSGDQTEWYQSCFWHQLHIYHPFSLPRPFKLFACPPRLALPLPTHAPNAVHVNPPPDPPVVMAPMRCQEHSQLCTTTRMTDHRTDAGAKHQSLHARPTMEPTLVPPLKRRAFAAATPTSTSAASIENHPFVTCLLTDRRDMMSL